MEEGELGAVSSWWLRTPRKRGRGQEEQGVGHRPRGRSGGEWTGGLCEGDENNVQQTRVEAQRVKPRSERLKGQGSAMAPRFQKEGVRSGKKSTFWTRSMAVFSDFSLGIDHENRNQIAMGDGGLNRQVGSRDDFFKKVGHEETEKGKLKREVRNMGSRTGYLFPSCH